MQISGLVGQKIDQTQGFLQDGTRIPLSMISLSSNVVSQVKTEEKDGYHAVQLAFGTKKKTSKALQGHIAKAGITRTPRFFREIRVETVEGFEQGKEISVEDVFKPGDIIDVIGVSKGKGYAGVVKRHGFSGGPRTHGQSDRERAPGSSGQGTTPGRVYKGKRMSGRMGNDTVTIKNLEIIDITDGVLYVKGLVPGAKGSIVVLRKVGENKNFTALFKNVEEVKEEEVKEEVVAQEPVEEAVVEVVEEAPKEEVAVEATEEATQNEEPVVEVAEEVTPAEEVKEEK